jgi:hypothetical protein
LKEETLGEEETRDAASNPDRLLPNENPSTRSLEDVTHWMAVYDELLTFKEALLASADRQLIDRSQQVGNDLSSATDLSALKAQNDRLRRRFEFWSELHNKLARLQP